METKLAKLMACLAVGDEVGALRIASRFPILGREKETITKGWAAYTNPSFYKELGYDPDDLFRQAIQAIRNRYANQS